MMAPPFHGMRLQVHSPIMYVTTATSSLWLKVSTDQTTLALSGLLEITYDFGVEAVCNSGTSGFSTAQQFQPPESLIAPQ
jgi:hypothetical protein